MTARFPTCEQVVPSIDDITEAMMRNLSAFLGRDSRSLVDVMVPELRMVSVRRKSDQVFECQIEDAIGKGQVVFMAYHNAEWNFVECE